MNTVYLQCKPNTLNKFNIANHPWTYSVVFNHLHVINNNAPLKITEEQKCNENNLFTV